MKVLDHGAVRRGRKVKGWSQDALGAICGIHQSQVWRIETGQQEFVTEDVAMIMSRNLDLTPWERYFAPLGSVAVPGDPNSPQSHSKSVAS